MIDSNQAIAKQKKMHLLCVKFGVKAKNRQEL